MTKNITIDVDEAGNVIADFSGYVGDTCLFDEAKLRELLKEMGLQVTVNKSTPKNQGMRIPIKEEPGLEIK